MSGGKTIQSQKVGLCALCIRYSARSNRCMKDMLMVMLTTALEELRWDDVAVISGRLTEFMRKENLGFVVRSRYKENLESEKASMFHVNREKKKGSRWWKTGTR